MKYNIFIETKEKETVDEIIDQLKVLLKKKHSIAHLTDEKSKTKLVIITRKKMNL